MPLEPALSAFAVSLACLALLLSPRGRRLMLDRPNQRSLHREPVPRSGGIAIAAGTAAGLAVAPGVPWALFGSAGALCVLSLADDVRPLPVLVRLGAHIAVAAAWVFDAFGPGHPVALLGLVLAVAWYANMYNFMDGADGLAGGMAVFGFGTYAFAAQVAGNTGLAAGCMVLAVGSLAFLFFNFHPARLFMGDAGSVPLGFLAGGLGLIGWRDGSWPLWFPLLVFAPFVGDASLTLLRRLLRRERVWEAHKEHYYQRLARMGFGHRGTAWIEYAAMAACGGLALLARERAGATQAAALVGEFLGLAACAAWIDLRWARRRQDPADVGG
jgi:UDP-N-acetylmuramyl pentapeptide phosphotransferase/UDP-N-acetylglucosamine-1-phosphate transferase